VWSWSLHESLKEGLDASPTKLELFKPPLWDFPGIPNVVKQLSIAPPRNSLDHVPSPERPVFWELACAMELKFWAALESELLFGGDLQTNPYWPVLQLAGRGLYSLGFDGDAFVVFGREHSDIAAPQS
jgi:hypothetical protein